MASSHISPGFIALHSNRAESLAEAVMAWLQRYPLDPLESETLLVQSNGVAEWLKMQLATAMGVTAATVWNCPPAFCGVPTARCWVRTLCPPIPRWTNCPSPGG